MALEFEWDEQKAASNIEKHGISFREAATAFGDFNSITIMDPHHSSVEMRFVLLGMTYHGRLVVVSHTERGHRIRIVNARRANRREQKAYEQG